MFLGVGSGELLLLVILAVLLLGPDRVPELARKAARVVVFLRAVGNNATSQLKSEIGLDVDDLKPADLHLAEVQAEMESMRTEMTKMRTEFTRMQLRSGVPRPLDR